MFVIAQSHLPPWWAFVAFFSAMLAVALFARNQDAGFFERLLRNDRQARATGLCSLAFGLTAAYVTVYSPVVDALAQRRVITLFRGAVAFPAIFVFVGLILLLVGNRSHKFVISRHSQQPTTLQRVTTTIGVVVCLALEFGLLRLLAATEYSAGW